MTSAVCDSNYRDGDGVWTGASSRARAARSSNGRAESRFGSSSTARNNESTKSWLASPRCAWWTGEQSYSWEVLQSPAGWVRHPWPFNRIQKKHSAARRFRRCWARMSIKSPPWSTARQRHCLSPWMVTKASSRYHVSPRRPLSSLQCASVCRAALLALLPDSLVGDGDSRSASRSSTSLRLTLRR